MNKSESAHRKMSRKRTRREPSFRGKSSSFEFTPKDERRDTSLLSSYLTEDLAQIQRFFPGARPVTLRTPFDIDTRPRSVVADIFHQEKTTREWQRVLRWIA